MGTCIIVDRRKQIRWKLHDNIGKDILKTITCMHLDLSTLKLKWFVIVVSFQNFNQAFLKALAEQVS